MPSNVIRLPVRAPDKGKKKTKKAKGLMPDGRYRVMVELDSKPDGSRNRVPVYGATYAKAKETADEMKKARRDGQNLADAKQTVAEWARRWLITYGSGAGYSINRSNNLYVRQVEASDLGKMPLKDVRDVHIQMFANAQSDRSKSAVGKIRSVVGRVFEKAVANRLIQFDPTVSIRWAHKGEGTHRALEDWEIELVIKHWREHRAGPWTMLMLFAGMRRGEALALQWSDIDMDAGVIHIAHGAHFEGNRAVCGLPKTHAGVRDVPILPPLAEAFTGLYGPPVSGTVCTGDGGRALTLKVYDRGWASWMKFLSEKSKRPVSMRSHDLRHTFCSILFDAGVDLKTAQYLMGHDDASMTMEVYTHLSRTRKTQSVDVLKKWCSKWCSDT